MPVKHTVSLNTQSVFSAGRQLGREDVNTKNCNTVDLA